MSRERAEFCQTLAGERVQEEPERVPKHVWGGIKG